MSYNVKSGIKAWAEDDRPREKLLNKGKASLSDAELVAILIGMGTREMSAVELSKKVLQSTGNNLMARSWQYHGNIICNIMAITWQYHCNIMSITLQCHRNCIANTIAFTLQ
jgi:DNA repair protein RadC